MKEPLSSQVQLQRTVGQITFLWIAEQMHELRGSILGFDSQDPRLEKNGDYEKIRKIRKPDPVTSLTP